MHALYEEDCEEEVRKMIVVTATMQGAAKAAK